MDVIHSYTAGLIDGEGTIALTRENRYAFRYPALTVTSTSRELVDFLKVQYGGSIIEKRTQRRSNHRRAFKWQITRTTALSVIADIKPFLREREKIRRAALLLNEYKLLTPRNGKYTPEMEAAKYEFEHRFFAEREYTRQPFVVALSDAGCDPPPRPPKVQELNAEPDSFPATGLPTPVCPAPSMGVK